MRKHLAVAVILALLLAALVPVAAVLVAVPLVLFGAQYVSLRKRREERRVFEPALRAITVARHLPRAGLLPLPS